MLIYSHKITPRIRYIFTVLLQDMMGLKVGFTSDKESFKSSTEPKISYSFLRIGDGLHFASQGLLHETGVKDQEIQIQENKDGKFFYSNGVKESDLHFDVFSASFFLLSRYEECLPHLRDQYNRFEAMESIAYKNNFLTEPIVDQWVLKLTSLFVAKWPDIPIKKREYRFISTIDIDNAYAYKHKGLLRTFGAFGRALLAGNFQEIFDRLKVHFGRRRDPYDTYDFQLKIQEKFDLETIYFLLVSDYGLNDKPIAYQNQPFQSLIKHLSDYASIGIHPGFNSNQDSEKLKTEKKRLENIIHQAVKKSRQHFLILHLPHTYQKLVENDIREDYTMGYAAHTGFRAGTCNPYRFYDLDLETPTELTVYPFAVMDATLKYYMNLSPDEAKSHITEIVQKVKAVNGTFISLWHNETLSDKDVWAGWRSVFTHLAKEAHR
ncbi:polysaccharide deacetylase family protein [Bacteroidota bacterium]